MKKLQPELGKRIAARRAALGLTRPQLAEKVGVQPLQVLRWEHGRETPILVNLLSLAAALEVAPGDLMSEEPARAT